MTAARVRGRPSGLPAALNIAVAHQRLVSERFMIEDPRSRVQSLDRYSVETIGRRDAEPLIARYEWLGNLGRATFFVGLVSPCRELHGVACFGHGPAGNVRKIIGDEKIGFDALCLERGACVHYAPPNAASFLINSACKLLHRLTGMALFFAYADPMAGEYGAVYQAAGWAYLGQGLDGKKGRESRYFVLAPGGDPNVASNWKTTRELRRQGRQLKFSDCVRLGDGERAGKHRDKWQVAQRAAKHVYAVYVGGKPRDRKAWRERLGGLAYPAPRPLMKRKPPPADRPVKPPNAAS